MFLATAQERVLIILNMCILYPHVSLQTRLSKLKLTFCNCRAVWQPENYKWLNIVSIMLPLNQKFTDFCQIELGIHASTIPSSWSKHNRKIFLSQGNTVQASDFETGAETQNFPWRKIKITKCERCTVKKFNKQFFRHGKSI